VDNWLWIPIALAAAMLAGIAFASPGRGALPGLAAGAAFAIASVGYRGAYAMRSAVDVRIVCLVEVIYSYAVSRRLFREPVTRLELWGMVLVVLGIVLVSLGR